MKIIVTIIILYLLYKLVFDFIVPVGRTTAQVRRQFEQMRNMQGNGMGQHPGQQQQTTQRKTAPRNQPPTTTTTDSEYIDFEEIK